MAITKNPQFQQNGFAAFTDPLNRYHQARDERRQDKGRAVNGRVPSRQADRVLSFARSHPLNNETQRTKKRSRSKKTIAATAHFPHPLMSRIYRRMETTGWSRSEAIVNLAELGEAVMIGDETAITLKALIEDVVRKNNKPYHAMYLALLVHIARNTGQNRYLSTNILGRMPGATHEIVKTNLRLSEKQAEENIRHTSPQVKKLMDELNKVLEEELEATKRA